MAKARAILKRRKAVKNIKKITKTMQMIATAKFQKSLKRAVASKPFTLKVRELVGELAASVGNVEHPMLRKIEGAGTGKVAMMVITSDRGLAGAYNGSVLRHAALTIRGLEAQGKKIDLFVSGKKGASYFTFAKRPFTRIEQFGDTPKPEDSDKAAGKIIDDFVAGTYDSVLVVYMNFISTGTQRPDAMVLLPLSSTDSAIDHVSGQFAEREAQVKAGILSDKTAPVAGGSEAAHKPKSDYEFSPDAKSLLDELLPLTVRSALFQALLDAKTSEHVARMVSMKSATDNADQMGRALAIEYNRARQSQITTELSEIMGGVEAMKGK
jgi:F-type H+-transporting ATPase subunit gamma